MLLSQEYLLQSMMVVVVCGFISDDHSMRGRPRHERRCILYVYNVHDVYNRDVDRLCKKSFKKEVLFPGRVVKVFYE